MLISGNIMGVYVIVAQQLEFRV